MRAALSAFILFCAAIGLFGWSGYEYVEASTGEQVSATVDRCESHTTYGRRRHTTTTCYGTWQRGGVSETGEISGVGKDDRGATVTARVHGGKAFAFDWVRVLVPAGIGAILLLASFVWLGKAVRGRKPAYYPQPVYYGPPAGYRPYPPPQYRPPVRYPYPPPPRRR